MTVRLSHVLLKVADLERMARFFAEVVGLTLRERSETRNGAPLVLFEGGIGLTPLGPGEVRRGIDHLAFGVADIADAEARVRSAGLVLVRRAHTERYGTSIYILDPEGVMIEMHG